MNKITISISREDLERKRKELSESGKVEISYRQNTPDYNVQYEDCGAVRSSGVAASFAYDSEKELLSVAVMEKPRLIPDVLVESKIRAWFQA